MDKKTKDNFEQKGWRVFSLYLALLFIGFILGAAFQQIILSSQIKTSSPIQTIPSITPPGINASILNISPERGDIGTKVTINGLNFSPTQNYVVFGAAYLGPFTSFNGKITFTIPDKATGGCFRPFDTGRVHCMAIILQTTQPGNYNISVLTAAGESNKVLFRVNGSPQ